MPRIYLSVITIIISNGDGGRYKLFPVWNNIIVKRLMENGSEVTACKGNGDDF